MTTEIDSTASDKAEIADIMIRYATGIDARDDEILRSCWAEDCVADYGEVGVFRSPTEVMDFMREAHKDMPATYHRISNISTEVAGDTATTRSYFHGLMDLGGGAWVDAYGHYDDELVRSPGGWKIRHRRVTIARQRFEGLPE